MESFSQWTPGEVGGSPFLVSSSLDSGQFRAQANGYVTDKTIHSTRMRSSSSYVTPNKHLHEAYAPTGETPASLVSAAEVMFRGRYAALKRIYEERLASLSQAFTKMGQELMNDEVIRTLQQDAASSAYLPDRLEEMISAELTAERTSIINDLSCRLAETEAALEGAQRDLSAAANVSNGLSRDIVELKAEYKAALDASLLEQTKLRDQLAATKQDAAALKAQHDVSLEQVSQLKAEVVQLKAAESKAIKAENELQIVSMQLAEEKNRVARLTVDMHAVERKEKDTAEKNQQLQFTVQQMKASVDAAEEKRVSAVHSAQEAELRFKAAHERMEHLMASEVDESGHALVEIKLRAEAERERLAEEVRRQRKRSKEGEKELQKLRSELLETQRLRESELDKSEGRVREVEAMMSMRLQQLQEQLSDAKKEADRSQLFATTVRAKGLQDGVGETSLQPSSSPSRLSGVPLTPAGPMRSGLYPNTQMLSGTVPSSHAELSQKLLADKLDEATTNVAQLKLLLKEEARKAVAAEQRALKAVQDSEQLRAQADGVDDASTIAQRRLATADKIIARAEQRVGAAEGRAAAAEEELKRVHAVSNAGRLELDRLREVSLKLEAMGEQSIRQLKERDQKVAELQGTIRRYQQEQQQLDDQLRKLELRQQQQQQQQLQQQTGSSGRRTSSNDQAALSDGYSVDGGVRSDSSNVGSLIIRRALALQVNQGLSGIRESLAGLSGEMRERQEDLHEVCEGALVYLRRMQRSQADRRQQQQEQQVRRREEQRQLRELQGQYSLVKDMCRVVLEELRVQVSLEELITPALAGAIDGSSSSPHNVVQSVRSKVREIVMQLQQEVESVKREWQREMAHRKEVEQELSEVAEESRQRQLQLLAAAATTSSSSSSSAHRADRPSIQGGGRGKEEDDDGEGDTREHSGSSSGNAEGGLRKGSVSGSVLGSSGTGAAALESGRRASALRRDEDWERNKTEFAMLAELQKLQTDSDMKELQSQLQEANRRADMAAREVNSRVAASLLEAANQATEDMHRIKDEHAAVVATLEARLKMETAKYRELQERTAREGRLHTQELSDAESKLVETQQELQHTRDELEEAQFTLQTERQQLKRLEKRLREIDEARARANSSQQQGGLGGSSHSHTSSPMVNRLLTPRMARLLNSPLPNRKADAGLSNGSTKGSATAVSVARADEGGSTTTNASTTAANAPATNLSNSTRSTSQFRSSFSTAASTPVGPRQQRAFTSSFASGYAPADRGGDSASEDSAGGGGGQQNGRPHHQYQRSTDYASMVVEEARRKLKGLQGLQEHPNTQRGLSVNTNLGPAVDLREVKYEEDKGDGGSGGDGGGGSADQYHEDGVASWSSEGVADVDKTTEGTGDLKERGRGAGATGGDIRSPPPMHPSSYRLAS